MIIERVFTIVDSMHIYSFQIRGGRHTIMENQFKLKKDVMCSVAQELIIIGANH